MQTLPYHDEHFDIKTMETSSGVEAMHRLIRKGIYLTSFLSNELVNEYLFSFVEISFKINIFKNSQFKVNLIS